MVKTIYVQLVSYKEELGGYIIYVFQVINNTSLYDKYMMITRLPRWNTPVLNIGDSGYLKYKEVIAGKDSWFNKETKKNVLFNYDGTYFIDFIKDKPLTEDIILLINY